MEGPASIKSPCLKICLYDPGRGLCSGCGRTVQEIGAWVSLSDTERERITAELPARLAALKPD